MISPGISGSRYGTFGWFVHLSDTYEAFLAWCSGTMLRLFRENRVSQVLHLGIISRLKSANDSKQPILGLWNVTEGTHGRSLLACLLKVDVGDAQWLSFAQKWHGWQN